MNRGYANLVRSTISRTAPNARDPLVFSDGGSATAVEDVEWGNASGPLLGRPRGIDGASGGNVFYADNTSLSANLTDRAAPPARQFRLLPASRALPVAPLSSMPPTVRLRMLSRDDQWYLDTSKVRQRPCGCLLRPSWLTSTCPGWLRSSMRPLLA